MMTNAAPSVSQAKYSSFCTHKTSFFHKTEHNSLTFVKQYAKDITPKELFDCQEEIHSEFNDLSSVLESMSVEKNTEQFFYFTLYCCYLLENYHAACGHYYEQKKYQQISQELIERLGLACKSKDKNKRKSFLDKLSQRFFEIWEELKLNILHPSKFSEKVGLVNLSRIILVLSRFSLSQLFQLLEEKRLLQQLGQFLNKDLSSSQLIERMSMFNGILNALSVAMFGSRWVRNVAATFYFVFCPTEEAQKALPNKLNRLYHQLYQRKGALLNDTVWTIVNGVTNYQLFGMSAGAALGITAGFMFFDIAVLLYLKHCDEQVYIKKQQQYQREIDTLIEKLSHQFESDSERKSVIMQLKFLEKQKLENEISWQQTASTYHFQTLACLMLATGFSFSLLVSSPVTVITCYTICLLAVSMVLSSGNYGKLQNIKAKRDHAEALSLNREALDKDYNQAQLTLTLDLVKNVVLPPILIGTFLICWEAGVALILSYMVMEGVRYYQQQKDTGIEEPDMDEFEACPVF